ncbi:alpha/beta hydrolase [Metabacillus idriensis]|uniref:alpha/beta hydrolase n=1 Tax=Metabacillus idriensis TaxID=324768 RepID=UPI001749BB96|nr:alpha/beta hydrolase [Metabacillus idriensis]
MIKKSLLAITLGVSLVLSSTVVGAASNPKEGTKNQATTPYFVDESKLPFTSIAGYETKRYWGVHNGAGYRIEVPENWNGELLLYAHGYRGTGLELTVSNPSIREHYIKNGYAWAASSYSTNGYDVAQGVKDTHALGTLFNGIVAKPEKTYITGHSMGGHVTAVLSEQYKNSYVGALPMCGVTGDKELFDFFTDYGLVAQFLSGIDREDQKFPSDEDYFASTVPVMKSTLGINKILTENGQKLKAVTMNLTGGQRPLFDAAFESYKNFLFDRMPTDPTFVVASKNVVNNTDSVYQFDADMYSLSTAEQNMNDSILRIKAHPSSKNKGLNGVPTVEGNHKIPMISLHDIGDLYVPFSMQQIHAERVKEKGSSDLLVTRAIRGVGHCDFTPQEESEAFNDLVNWVEEGIRPEGDNVLDPTVVADPKFGTKFTRTYRAFDPLRYSSNSSEPTS